MTDLRFFIAELAAMIAAGYVQADVRYEDRGRARFADRRSPLDVARYSVQIAEEISALVNLGPADLEALHRRREARMVVGAIRATDERKPKP